MKSALKIFPRSLHRLSFFQEFIVPLQQRVKKKTAFYEQSLCLLSCWLDCEQLSLS
jgi:hypothetical protein